MVHADRGRQEEARAEFERLAVDDFARVPEDFNWIIAGALLAEVCAFLDDAPRAVPLYTRLLPYADRSVFMGWAAAYYGSASRYLGLLAATMRRWQEAETRGAFS